MIMGKGDEINLKLFRRFLVYLDLRDGVFVGSLDQEGAGLGVLASFNESVLLFSKLMLVNGIGVSL